MLTRGLSVAFAASSLLIVGGLSFCSGPAVHNTVAGRGRQPMLVRSCGNSNLTDVSEG